MFAGGGAAGGGGGGGGGGPNWSKGHGVDSVDGKQGVKKDKTPLYQSGAQSVAANWGSRVDLGTVQQAQSGPIDISLVPRRSNPAEFRPIATKHGGGGAAGPTSFPMRHDHPDAVRLSGGRTLTDRPDSPPPAAAAAPAALVFMPPVAAPAPAPAPPPAVFAPIALPAARAAAAAPMAAVQGPPRGGAGSGTNP